MNHARVLYHLAKADFLVRVRRTSFLITLAFAVFLGYETFAGKIVLRLDDYRGLYNSAWIGALMGVVTGSFVTLVGFYVVKGSILRDQTTRVGQILAATPMSKSFYTVAKALGNFAVLAAMVAVMGVAALLMQVLRGEDRTLHLVALFGPLIFLALPAAAVVASIAVLFETLPVLRGGVGNVVWFFLWTGLIVAGVPSMDRNAQAPSAAETFHDFSGLGTVFISTRAALVQIHPGFPNDFALSIGGQKPSQTFLWNGIDWSSAQIAARLTWVIIAVLVALLASVFFHRFDPARVLFARRRAKAETSKAAEPGVVPGVAASDAWTRMLTPLTRVGARTNFGQLVIAELRLMLKGQKWWWYLGAIGLFIACLASPLPASRSGVILAAWIWPLLLWSQMGSREARWSTRSLIFSCPDALRRQLPAEWIAGVIVAMATGGGLAIRLLLAADWPGLAGWCVAALFIPSLALALGLWSGSSKFFEALYTAWWYVGPLHHTHSLDFIGTVPASSTPAAFALLTGLLLASCWLRRRSQLAYA